MESIPNNSLDLIVRNELQEGLPLIRQPLHLLIIYCVVYAIIFIIGLAGNAFVVIAVALNISMRNITNYLITNLAIADVLIIIMNVPATLGSNIFFGKSEALMPFRNLRIFHGYDIRSFAS